MAIGYLDYLTNNGVRYFPYVRVEGIINTDGKPFSQWMTQVNTHNHDIRYAASAHQHSGYLKNVGPNDIRATASYVDPLNIIADNGGTAEIKLYSSANKDDVGAIQYKNTVLSMRINETARLNLQGDGVYFNSDKLATEEYIEQQLENGGGGAGVDLDVLDQRYASNVHNHMANEITGLPDALPNPSSLTISFGTSKSVTYDGRTPQTLNISTSDLDIDIPSIDNFDNRYYKKNTINTTLDTNLLIDYTPSGADAPDIINHSTLGDTINSYEYYGLEHTSREDYPNQAGTYVCKGFKSSLNIKENNTDKIIYEMNVIKDTDGMSKLYINLSKQGNAVTMNRDKLPIIVLSGGNDSTSNPINPEAIINGDLIVKGNLKPSGGIIKDNPISITLTAANWSGSGPYTQAVYRPTELINDFPTLVKNLSYDATPDEIVAYNIAFAILCEGCAATYPNNITFKVLKKPETDITVALVQ